MMAAGCTMLTAQTKNTQTLMPLTERVNVQADSARINQIIDGCWVAVGTNKPHAIQRDFTNLFDGKPSYRFELKTEDNTLEGYAKGETKGRAEFSYCYATSDDFRGLPADVYQKAQITKTVYHHGKGACPQGSSRDYEFSVYIPSSLDSNVSTIFAQWHGMPDRTLVQTPQGEVKKLTVDEFVELEKTTFFKKNVGHEKVARLDKQGNPVKDKNGKPVYKAGKPNGWLVEQGGYPPLAFGFSGGLFYIKANSDRKWLTDKDDEGNTHYENEENAASSKILFDTFVKHLQVAKICQPGDSSCLPTVNKGSFYSGILANGMSFNFIQRSGSCSSVSGTTPQLKNICADLTVDIDGPAKGRNAWGKDWFRFHITKYGLIPKGTKEDTKWSFEKVCYTTNTATYNGDYGESCTAWVMYNENTDYLRCKNLSWDGKHKCR